MTPEQIWHRIDDGLPKLWVIRQTLRLRHERQFFLPEDSYRAILARGAKSDHVVAFARGERAITVVPRLTLEASPAIGATRPSNCRPGRWRNVLTGEIVEGGEVRMADSAQTLPCRSPYTRGGELMTPSRYGRPMQKGSKSKCARRRHPMAAGENGWWLD